MLEKLGLGPMVTVSDNARDRHLLFSLRRRAERQLVCMSAT